MENKEKLHSTGKIMDNTVTGSRSFPFLFLFLFTDELQHQFYMLNLPKAAGKGQLFPNYKVGHNNSLMITLNTEKLTYNQVIMLQVMQYGNDPWKWWWKWFFNVQVQVISVLLSSSQVLGHQNSALCWLDSLRQIDLTWVYMAGSYTEGLDPLDFINS